MTREEVMSILAFYSVDRLNEELDVYEVVPMYFALFGKGPSENQSKRDMLVEMKNYRDSELQSMCSFAR